jgi:hypothetical protein
MYIVRHNAETNQRIIGAFVFDDEAYQFANKMGDNLQVECIDTDCYCQPIAQVEYKTTVPIYMFDDEIGKIRHRAKYVEDSCVRDCLVRRGDSFIEAISARSIAESKRNAIKAAVDYAYQSGNIDDFGKPCLCFDDPDAEFYFRKNVTPETKEKEHADSLQ